MLVFSENEWGRNRNICFLVMYVCSLQNNALTLKRDKVSACKSTRTIQLTRIYTKIKERHTEILYGVL